MRIQWPSPHDPASAWEKFHRLLGTAARQGQQGIEERRVNATASMWRALVPRHGVTPEVRHRELVKALAEGADPAHRIERPQFFALPLGVASTVGELWAVAELIQAGSPVVWPCREVRHGDLVGEKSDENPLVAYQGPWLDPLAQAHRTWGFALEEASLVDLEQRRLVSECLRAHGAPLMGVDPGSGQTAMGALWTVLEGALGGSELHDSRASHAARAIVGWMPPSIRRHCAAGNWERIAELYPWRELVEMECWRPLLRAHAQSWKLEAALAMPGPNLRRPRIRM